MVHFSYNLTISYNSYLAYEVVFLHHLRNSTGPKGTPLEYFRLCETFFRKKIHRRVPLQFFDIFRQNGCWKIPKGPPFQFFRHCETFFNFFLHKRVPNSPILWIDKSFCYFRALDMTPTWAVPGLLSLKQGADFRLLILTAYTYNFVYYFSFF